MQSRSTLGGEKKKTKQKTISKENNPANIYSNTKLQNTKKQITGFRSFFFKKKIKFL